MVSKRSATVPLGPDILYCTTYIPVMHLCTRSADAAAAAAASALCVAILLLLLQLQLLAAAARHRVPDGNICCRFIEFDASIFFLFVQTRSIFNAPLGSAVAFSASIFR